MAATSTFLVRTNGIRLSCTVAGDGPLVVLLHGFPECAASWRHQIPVLAERYQVVAPDLRGYNLSDKPHPVSAYAIRELVADVEGLVSAFGADRARLVGHDWGGGVAWATAMLAPQVVSHLGIINMPHPLRFETLLRTSPRQMLRSWYVLAFQLPGVPEWLLSRHDGQAVVDAMRKSVVVPGALSEDYLRTLRAAATRPGGMRGPVNYYRAAVRFAEDLRAWPRVRTPTLLVWGDQDIALTPELPDGTEALIDAPFRLERIPEGGHFVHEEYPDRVNALLTSFLGS